MRGVTFTGFTGTNMPAFRDDFDRANSATLGLSWREGDDVMGSDLRINGNDVDAITAGFHSAYWDGIESNHVGFAFTIIFADQNYDVCGAVVTADAGNGVNPIYFHYTALGAAIEIYYDNSVLEATVALSETFVNTDVIGIEVKDAGSDNVYKIFRRAGGTGNWSQVGTHTDTSAARGGPWDPGFGLAGGATGATVDNFWAEEVTSAEAEPRRVAGWIVRS